MATSFTDPTQVPLKAGEVVSATFIEDPEGEYEFNGRRYRATSYFAAPVDASDDWMRERAFEAHHGKPMDEYQRWVMEEAKAGA